MPATSPGGSPGPSHRVVVVGAGIVGLSAALTLLRAGHRVEVVSADATADTTSAVAAAVWFPTHVGPPERVARWGAATYAAFARQAAAGVPGVLMRDSLSLYRHDPGTPDWVAAVGAVGPARLAELPPGYRHGLRYAVPLAEMPRYLPWLVARVAESGGRFTRRRLKSLEQVGDADVVVNCSGLGAATLVGDDALYPVRGQVVRVANPGLRLSVRDEVHPGGRAYVHPRSADCVLGGTLEEGRWDLDPDPAADEAILARCRELVPALGDAPVLGRAVGLRPGRPSVRLEEDRPLPSGARLVHDYGHGGAGMTLCWGCADEVAAIVAADPTFI